MADYATIEESRTTAEPRQRLTSAGYTVRSGSPTRYQVRCAGEKRWRRVYVICFSNVGSLFIRTPHGPRYVHEYELA